MEKYTRPTVYWRQTPDSATLLATRCWDNAVSESFFHTLKTECVNHENYATREAARKSIFDYIEVFYNRQRLHSNNGYLSPVEFENQHKAA